MPAPTPLEEMTKTELYAIAQDLDVDGRSSMNTDELLAAIQEHRAMNAKATAKATPKQTAKKTPAPAPAPASAPKQVSTAVDNSGRLPRRI